ncbi:MAG: substrate-binding domain-containing protein [Actinomycetota bacterium]
MRKGVINKILFVVLILCLSVVTIGCRTETVSAPDVSVSEDVEDEISPESEEFVAEETLEEKVYTWIGAVVEIPYFIDHRIGLELAGLTFGADTKFLGPTGYDMGAMINTIEQVIAENPAGIEIIGFVEELAPAVNKAIEAGIPVVTLDADTATSDRYTFIGTGNYNAGRQSAQILAEALNGQGKVAVTSVVGQTNLDERLQGFRDELTENYPNMELIQVVDHGSDEQKAADGVKAVIQANPDLAGVAAVEATGGNGAATAVKEMEKVGDIVIVSMDRDDTTLKAIEDGIIHASVAQRTALMSYLGVMLMESFNKGSVSITKDDEAANIIAMPEVIDTGTIVINKDNAAFFYHKDDPFDYSDWELTPPEEDETYVWIGAVVEIPYFIDHRAGLEAAGEELGVKTKFLGPTGYDMGAMINTIEQVIAENPAGIEIIGFVEELAPAVNKAIEAGIPVVTLDADTATSDRYTFIGTGNYNAGRQSAQILAEALNGQGKVAVTSVVGQTNLDERLQGFRDELTENYPNMELIQVVDHGSDEQKAADGVKAVIQANPDLAGVAAVEATGGNGAATAVKEMEKVGDIVIVSMDRDDTTLKAIEDGIIHASVAQRTALMSYLGVKLMYYYNHGRIPISQDDETANIIAMPEVIDTGTIVINKDNAAYFYH